jgi:hypothetical protein
MYLLECRVSNKAVVQTAYCKLPTFSGYLRVL